MLYKQTQKTLLVSDLLKNRSNYCKLTHITKDATKTIILYRNDVIQTKKTKLK